MGYDIHIHASDQDASLQLPGVSLRLEQHEAVFARPGVDASEYPLISRMAAFHADAMFPPGVVAALVIELEKLQSEFQGIQQESWIVAILDICRKAAGQGHAVTCYCD